MFKHKIEITPLNCAFSNGLNSIIKFEESEYLASTDRAVYCKDIDLSWFKMKSVTNTPYLEPVFYGLNEGDIITVEFDSLIISGLSSSIGVNFFKVNADYSTSGYSAPETVYNILPDGSIKSFYKHFKISGFAENDGIGTLLNIRPSNTNNEMIIKNIEVTIETSNQLFSATNNIVSFRTKTDYMKCIDFYSGTNLNPVYNSLLALYNGGKINFTDDNTLQFKDAGTTVFKGLMSLFNGHKYRPTFAVYAEYSTWLSSSPENTVPGTLSITSKAVKEDGTFIEDGSARFPVNTTWSKRVVYLNGGTSLCRKSFLDIGTVTGGTDLTLKNVRLSMPQFDDTIKREPNQLEELYTNLSSKLR